MCVTVNFRKIIGLQFFFQTSFR